MIIAISGTPATGKTSAAKILSRLMGANLISISQLVKSGEIKSILDRDRKTEIVDENAIKKAVRKHIKKECLNIVEGHASHIIKADKIFLLRCDPRELMKRMIKKRWKKSKMIENVQAEILDVILIEALEYNRKTNIIEIDTSSKTPRQMALLMKKLLNNHSLQKKYVIGKIDWLEKYKNDLQ